MQDIMEVEHDLERPCADPQTRGWTTLHVSWREGNKVQMMPGSGGSDWGGGLQITFQTYNHP